MNLIELREALGSLCLLYTALFASCLVGLACPYESIVKFSKDVLPCFIIAMLLSVSFLVALTLYIDVMG